MSKISTLLIRAALGALAICLSAQTVMAACPVGTAAIMHSTNIIDSYCELCSTDSRPSTVRLIVNNEGRDNDLTGLVITETLPAGMNYVTGSATVVAVLDGTAPSIFSENISGSTVTWTLSGTLDSRRSSQPANWMSIDFEVYRSDEGLISSPVNYSFSAALTYDAYIENSDISDPLNFVCSDTDSSGSQTLPLREPLPSVGKSGWNVDAGQSEGQAAATVYGHGYDDVIWRLQFSNSGRAPLEDLIFDDTMLPGNMQVNYACTSAAAAQGVANNDGAEPGACFATYEDRFGAVRAVSNTIQGFAVDDPFGNPSGDEPASYIDVPIGGSAFVYLVGKLEPDASCAPQANNSLVNIEWGCELDAPDGGLTQTSSGASAGSATTVLTTRYGDVDTALSVNRQLTGANTAQPVGTRGTMTVTLSNNTGGSVTFSDALAYHLKDALPSAYVLDPTYTPTIAVTSLFGSYPGRLDTIAWSNPAPGTFPIDTGDALSYLNNTDPEFKLSSSDAHPLYPQQRDMLRHGDVATISYGVVLIRSDYFDRTANLDVSPEDNTLTAQNTDPDPGQPVALSNSLEVRYDTFCPSQGAQSMTLSGNGNGNPNGSQVNAFPEDLDIAIGGGVFILTGDPTQLLTLPVLLNNNGGHDAEDYHLFATFGTTMDVVNAPSGCSQLKGAGSTPAMPDQWQPAAYNVWGKDVLDPINIPSTAAVYECTSPSTIAPGQQVTYNFQVRKTADPARVAIDDLTFRADVVGEATVNDGTPLWFPAPLLRTDGLLDRANNYSLDAAWARVIGFNLKKSQLGACRENNPPTFDANGFEEVQIGEECSFHIETGGWFGFETPGFAYIAVQNVDVVDEIPDGQGYIFSSDPLITSTAAIQNVTLSPAGLLPVTAGWFDWRFNVDDAERIEVMDQWFRVDATTRILNDPLDNRAAPNLHAAESANILNSTFDATFQNNNTGLQEKYPLGPTTIGYPNEPLRRVDLTVTEPAITIVKEVCNEDLYGVGPGCSNFLPLANDGDAYDAYIYRLTVSNSASAGGVRSAPAYDVTVNDLLDASDLAYVLPFDSDGLDNDGDGAIDEGGNAEGLISNNIVKNGDPAQLTFTFNDSSALLRIDPGQSVNLFYRVDYDDDAAPLQIFSNRADANYDSLESTSGSQSLDPRPTSDSGGARAYTSAPAVATVQILPVVTRPKRIAALSSTPLAGGATTQGVAVGEEIDYRLSTLLPVALLRSFGIRDELPAGMRCIEAPVIDLGAPPYAAAGFVPGGSFTPTCSDSFVEWNFGDQRVTNGNVGSRFDFEVGFIARVENSATNNDSDLLSNGDPATSVTASYINEAGSSVVLNIGQVDVQLREPDMILSKNFAVASSDAADILTVSVTASNSGTATAYNLRILDDLLGSNLSYIGNLGGANPPDGVDTTTLGPERPIFSWSDPAGIAPASDISFTFEVLVAAGVAPHEVLDDTIEADWSSLPGSTSALNSGGAIGADGSLTGMRIGALPNAGDLINDYEASAAAQTTVPAVSMNKNDLSATSPAAIGAHHNFEIEIVLPEGVTDKLLVTDRLDAAGISYLLENNAAYDISYSFQDIASINGQLPDEAAFNAFPSDATSGSAVWDIGTVVTLSENDTANNGINPLLRINYHARIDNDLVTDDGDLLQNSVIVNYRNGESGAQETLSDATQLTVSEPLLSASKSVSQITPGPISGGSLLEYTVTIDNLGSAVAFDLNLVDTLPPELLLYGSFTPSATIGGTPVTGFVATPDAAPGGPLVWGRDNGDGSLDLPAGERLVLTYRAQVQISSVSTFNNEVWVDWSSLDGVDGYERTGAGCPTVTAPNDYCAGPATAVTTTSDNNGLSKTVIADSYVDAFSSAGDATVRIGDTVTYRLTLELGEGTTRSVLVSDQLPAGMAFESLVAITPGPGAGFSYTLNSSPLAGQSGNLIWDFADIVNPPSNDGTPLDILTIEYLVRVLPDAMIPHLPGITLTNRATLSYLDVNGLPVIDSTRLESQATISVRQPLIAALLKSDRSGRTSPASVDVTSDIMNFRLQACNASGLAPAYSVLLNDALPSQLDESSIAGPSNGPGQPDVIIDGALATPGLDYLYTPPNGRGDSMSFLLITPLDPGACLSIDYDIGFYSDFGPQTWDNLASLDQYWSLPLQSGQLYGPVGPATFSMLNVVNVEPPQKDLVSPPSGEATIGEEIVYQILVPATPRNGALYDVAISDTLNANLEYIGASEISGNNFPLIDNSPSATQLNLFVAHIPAGQQALIELRTRLGNLATSDAGMVISNTATYTFADSPGGTTLSGGSSTSAPVTIVEPQLSLAKAVVNLSDPGNPPQAGDTLRYTLDIGAAGGAVGDNFSSAYDLHIDDQLSLGLVYAGNPAVSGAGNSLGTPLISGDGSTTPQSLTWDFADATADIDVPEGTLVTVSYDVRVLDAVVAGQVLTNSASLQWTGINGSSADERAGSGVPPYNDYLTAPVSTTVTVAGDTTLSKTIIADSYVDASSSADDKLVRIGDIATYRLSLNLGEGTTRSVTLQDLLPAGMVYLGLVGITPVSGSGPFTYTLGSQPLPGATGTLTWELGDVVNPPSNDGTLVDSLVIEYQALVQPDAGIAQAPATDLTNTATLGYRDAFGSPVIDATRLVASDTLRVLQPLLTPIVKLGNGAVNSAATPLDVNVAADTVQFRLETCNATGQAPAYGVLISDILPSQIDENSLSAPLVAVDGTILGASDYSYTPPAARGGSLIFVLNTPVAPNECLTIDYSAAFHTDFGPNQLWNNSASVDDYDSLPGGAGQGYVPDDVSQFFMTNVVSGEPLVKSLLAPASGEATIGEQAVYQITLPGAPISAALDNVVMSDTLHDALVFVAATATLNGAPLAITTVQSGQELSWDIPTIPAGQQAVITLTVRVANNDFANAGTSIVNSAAYSYDAIPAGETTDGSSAPLTIVEPSVSIAKSVDPATSPLAGDILTYTVALSEAGGSFSTDAYDAVLDDRLSLGLSYVAGSARVGGATNEPTVSGDGVSTPQTLLWGNVDIPRGTTVSVSYEVRVLDTVVAGNILTNSASLEWTSRDGASADERTGSGSPATNDYFAGPATTTLIIATPDLSLQKVVDKPVANPGDRLLYTLTIENPTPIRLANFTLVDSIEAQNATPRFQPGSLGNVVVPPGASYVLSGTTLTVSDLNIDPHGSLTVQFEAVLLTDLASGSVVLNQAQLTGPWPAPIQSDDPTLPGSDDPTESVIPANGIVYDVANHAPLAGVTLTMLRASTSTPLPTNCFVDPVQQNQTTQSDGAYKFDLVFDPSDCPAGEGYLLAVTTTPPGYVAEPSLSELPLSDASTAAYPVLLCPDDAVAATGVCEADAAATVPAGTPNYYLHLNFDATANQIYNNHIPVDQKVEEKIAIFKTTPQVNVTRGQIVPYAIRVKNTLRSELPPLGVVDTLPPGFKFVSGSGRYDGAKLAPVATGGQLRWDNLDIGYNQEHTIELLLIVGGGVSEGKFVNRAQVVDSTSSSPLSELATATVRVVADPDFDCSDVIGKVFDDRDLDGEQTVGERGLAGVRVVTARGLTATTDPYGRFHITCATIPDAERGSNFILKLDDRSLPTGYRIISENPRVQRATRGKALRFNFATALHRVVSIDVAADVFELEGERLREVWQPRIDQLIEVLREQPSILRISYLADVEEASLVESRLEALRDLVEEAWREQDEELYRLTVETSLFWRRGKPL